ncbi:hypothetical protein AtEden1_Chr5g0113181 [Arabidopsis thaliana]
MLKRRVVSDPGMRIRCACLAIVDGFLVPTSHYPKIVKSHTEMVEDGLLYALQLVVLQAAPTIQDGHVIDNPIESDSEGAEDDVEVATRESVPFKLGNAKEFDEKCSIPVASIICLDYVLDLAEYLSWSDDEEDERVENLLMLVNEGLIFKNDIFESRCFPSQLQLTSKKQKRGAKSNVSRNRKATKLSKNHGGVR